MTAPKQCALCWNKARIGVTCDACRGSMQAANALLIQRLEETFKVAHPLYDANLEKANDGE